MQCIILAAGEGTRMRPLTLERPKPLVSVAGMPLLEHILRALPEVIDEVIIVIGYKGDMIKAHIGDAILGKQVRYVEQRGPKGTAQALMQVRDLIRDKFLLVHADDLLDEESLRYAVQKDLCVLAYQHENPEKFGVILLREDGTLAEIIEKPEIPPSNLVSTGAMVLDRRVFDFIGPPPEKGEHYLTWSISALAQAHPIDIVHMNFWCPVGAPEDIPRAEALLALNKQESLSTPFVSEYS